MDVLDQPILRERAGRLIGICRSGQPGPTVVCFGGIHGNEPAGVKALERVFGELSGKQALSAGTLIGIRGNLQALAREQRYLNQDLNRMWTDQRIAAIGGRAEPDRSSEEQELHEIYKLLKHIRETSSPPFYFIDLHTTSSPTLPFVTMNDAVINRKFARLFPVPVILGIEEFLEGPLLSFINRWGYVSIGFESGQHSDIRSVDRAVDFVRMALVYAGLLPARRDPDFEDRRVRLREAAKGDHRFYEVFYRHALQQPERFRMVSGLRSFEPMQRGHLLAHDDGVPIYMKKKGILFMPLYQKQGEEGFFLIRRIPVWALRFSAWLRKFRFQNMLAWLPGIRWEESGSDKLLVDLRIARFLSKPIFHLLGYRIYRRDRTHLVLTNRERAARNSDYEETFWYRQKEGKP